jgi:hypothetical protein
MAHTTSLKAREIYYFIVLEVRSPKWAVGNYSQVVIRAALFWRLWLCPPSGMCFLVSLWLRGG